MNKILILFGLFIGFFLFGCEKVTVLEIKVDTQTVPSEINIDDFKLSDIKLIVKYSDNTNKEVSVNEAMLSSDDLDKLKVAGEYIIEISYRNKTCILTITLVTNGPYEVIFKAFDEQIGETQYIEKGTSAVAPTPLEKEGYVFIGWDKDFSEVKKDLIVNAMYEAEVYTVVFMAFDKQVGETQYIEYGTSAVAPTPIEKHFYNFIGWDKDFSEVKEDLVITGEYDYFIYRYEAEGRNEEIEKDIEGKFGYIEVIDYLGTFNDCYIVNIRSTLTPNAWFQGYSYELIGDVYFVSHYTNRGWFFVWNPEISQTHLNYFLSDAYEYGYLSLEDIHNIPWPKVSEIPDDPNNVGVLDEKTELQIKETYFDQYLKYAYPKPTTAEEVIIYGYYGTYNKYAIVAVQLYSLPPWGNYYMPVGDIYFYCSSHNKSRMHVIAWKNGKFYELQALYKEGKLSLDDIHKIPRLIFTEYYSDGEAPMYDPTL